VVFSIDIRLNTYCGVLYWYQAKHILWCSVLISGFLGDKEASQSWSSLAVFRVECRPPDHEALVLTATANSCNNCIKPFHTYLAEDEFRLTETRELVLTRTLINYFAPLVEQMTLSPTHMIVGVEPSPDDIFQIIILLWQLLCFSTDTAEVSQFKWNCAWLKTIHKL
jgi:hypothetical protein